MESQLGFIENSFDLRYTNWVREALNELPDCFTITDPYISGHPIVYASNGFLKMVGYSRDEVIGRNGRIFQGPETDRRSVMEIREAIRGERGVRVNLLNYRKDGTKFWMLFEMCPVFSKEDGRVINFVGVQVPILRRRRLSGFGIVRSEINLSDDGGTVVRCCRREVCSDSILELRRASAPELVSSHGDREVEINEPCEASELEKTKASAAISNILSVLTHYSELTGRLVCRKRCCLTGNQRLVASLNISLGRIKQSFVLTDALLPDMPIVYASEAFLKLTGYAKHEVLGQNCRFLSGTDTDPSMQFQIKECIRCQQACTVRILNYRKDGTSFWNFLHISPVRNASGKVAFFVGIQIDDQCNNRETHGLKPEMRQLSVVGAVKVAVRSLSMGASTS
uniref:Putative LOV domain-containing protein n=1 Tax=Lindenbergia philippensis TaxID=86093 RepID=A0A126WY25_LINPH|nr:putative LOV domain-containing protein [Lindenbergia philippensis]